MAPRAPGLSGASCSCGACCGSAADSAAGSGCGGGGAADDDDEESIAEIAADAALDAEPDMAGRLVLVPQRRAGAMVAFSWDGGTGCCISTLRLRLPQVGKCSCMSQKQQVRVSFGVREMCAHRARTWLEVARGRLLR